MEELSRDRAVELLTSEAVAHVATAAGGEPYVTPISFVVLGDELLFRTTSGRRLDALKANPRVCIEASRTDEDGSWESVLVWGDARIVDDPYREADVVAALLAKYHQASEGLFSTGGGRPFDPKPVVVAVPLSEVSGRSSGAGLNPRTRPGRL